MRILIIEDELKLQQQLADALRAEDYVVDTASDGEEGLYFAQEYPIDLMVLMLSKRFAKVVVLTPFLF